MELRTPLWRKADRDTLIAASVFFLLFLIRTILAAQVGLGDDEAYYWDWSRHLAISYYDHPGMTAWLIKIGTVLFGDTPLGVRVTAVFCNTLSGYLLWLLGRSMFGVTAAWVGALLYVFVPGFNIGTMLMVPDAPMGLMWMVTLLCIWRIIDGGEKERKLWWIAGLAMGLGILSKFTIVLLAALIVLLFLVTKDWRGYFRRSGFWSALGISVICGLPILIWNAQRGWPTLMFHLRDRQSGGLSWSRWGQFFGSQAGLLSPFVFLAVLAVLVIAFARREDKRWRMIFFLSFPVFALFALQALFAEFKPHWPAPSYMLAFIGIGALWQEGFGLHARALAWARSGFAFLAGVLCIPVMVLFNWGTLEPVIPKAARALSASFNIPLVWEPKFDPTNDFYGWDELAQRMRELRAREVAAGREEPFLASWRYQLVAQLAFATREDVYRSTRMQKDEYSFIHTRDVLKKLEGKSAIFFADNRFERDPSNDGTFASCEAQEPLKIHRGEELARVFKIWICRGYILPPVGDTAALP